MRTGNIEVLGFVDHHLDARFRDDSGLTTFPAHGFKAPPAIATPTTWTLPDRDGVPGAVFKTDGAGGAFWSLNPGATVYKQSFDNSQLTGAILTVNHGISGGIQCQVFDFDDYLIIPDAVRMTDKIAGICLVDLNSFLESGVLPGDPNTWTVVIVG